MAVPATYAELSRALGLSDLQSRIYGVVVANISRTAEEVHAYLPAVPLDDIRRNLDELCKKEFLRKIPPPKRTSKAHDVYIAMSPPVVALAEIGARIEEVEGLLVGLGTTWEKTRKTYDHELAEIYKKSNNEIVNAKSRLKDLGENIESDLSTGMADAKSILRKRWEKFCTEIVEDLKETIVAEMQGMETELNSMLSGEIDDIEEFREHCRDVIPKRLEKFSNELSNDIESWMEKQQSSSDDFIERLTAALQRVSSSTIKIAHEQQNQLDSMLNDLSVILDKQVEQTSETLLDPLEGEFINLPTILKQTLRRTVNSLHFIQKLRKESSVLPVTFADRSFLIVGTDQIWVFLRAVLQRTGLGGQCNLLIPRISIIPPDLFSSASPRARLHLLTKIDDRVMLEELKTKHNNLTIRDFDVEIVAFFRDATEEAGVGTVYGREGEMSMIVTTEAPLVRTLNGLFNQYWPSGKNV